MSRILSTVLSKWQKAIVLVNQAGLRIGEHEFPMTVKTDRHAHVEDGEYWLHNGIHINLPAAGKKYHLLRTLTASIHLAGFTAAGDTAPMRVYITEAPTILIDGIPAEMRNKNRDYTDTPPVNIFEDCTLTDEGLYLTGDVIFGSKQEGGSPQGGESELVLKKNTDYLMVIENLSAQAADLYNFHFELYPEEIPVYP